MNQVLEFINQYKDFIVLGVALIGGLIFYGKKKVAKFVMAHLGTIEGQIAKAVTSNPQLAEKIYGMLPKSLKAFTTVKAIAKIIAKFLDK
jgi:hypothetical protein